MVAMDEEELKMYLQNIEEYVMDENKIVTYKWLSKTLDVHVNTAKQLLYSFAREQKRNVHLTYLLGGVLCDGTGCKIQIVREEELEEMKKTFKVLTSEHVYSVQKTKTLPDLSILYAVDSHKRGENEDNKRLGAVQFSHSILRTTEEIERLRLKARAATACADGKQWPTKSAVTNKKAADKASNKEETVTTSERSKVENTKQKEVKNGMIAAMFATQNNKKKKDESTDGQVKIAEKSAPKSKAGGGITMFFSRQMEKPKTPADNDNPNSAMNSQDSQSNVKLEEKCKMESSVEHEYKKDVEKNQDRLTKERKKTDVRDSSVKNTNKKGKVKNSENNSLKQNVKRERGRKSKKSSKDEESVPAKKRKRIVVMSDSEDSSDDDIFDNNDEDAPYSPPPSETAPQQPESDAEDVIPPTPEAEMKKGRKRVRKLVDKTYMAEEYLMTSKEYVFESCTDSEAEQEKENEKRPKENDETTKSEEFKTSKSLTKEPPAKKKASPQKTKQATIMNFFKKST